MTNVQKFTRFMAECGLTAKVTAGYMTDVMTRLEEYRKAHGLSIEQMARLLGANSRQQYWNWKNANSLPKTYFRRAAEVLGDDPGSVAPLSSRNPKPEDAYENSIFSKLTQGEKRQVVLKILPELSAEDRALALRYLLELE